MNASSPNTPHTITDRVVVDADAEVVEPGELELRDLLGVRPTNYFNDAAPASHPDQRPCPPWCWIGQQDEYGHEVDPHTPMEASHHIEHSPTVPASLYRGISERHQNVVQTATWELSIEQLGQRAPIIRVNLRHWRGGEHLYEERMRLTVDDLCDFVKAAEYLIQQADRDEAGRRERNAFELGRDYERGLREGAGQ